LEIIVKSAALALSILLAVSSHAAAQQTKPQVLVLGVYHMAGSSDYIQTAQDDVLSPKRQREMQELADRLAVFRPTKIMVEAAAARDSSLNTNYRRYLAGSDTLTRNEIDQIGFRLAKQLGHDRIYAIDYKQNEDIGSVMGWAGQHGDTAFINLVQRFGQRMQAQAQKLSGMTIPEYLRLINTEAEDALGQGAYLRMARVGRDTTYVGADVVATRYARNLKIYANMARLIVPGDRVLVIYGAGHGHLLRQFIRYSPDLELVDAGEYLASR
jgi:hypothetical protein